VHLGLEDERLEEHLEAKTKNLVICVCIQRLECLLAGLGQKRNTCDGANDRGEKRVSDARKLQTALQLPGCDAIEYL
jgi:hypothetical protein